MGENSEIGWTDHTFNGWIGCQKVSAGCDNCYAETLMDKRYHRVQWGPHGERVRTSEANWKKPLQWNRAAEKFARLNGGRRQRVFCSSLADVFDNQAPAGARGDLWNLIAETQNLEWLLLTKRPENIAKMLPAAFGKLGNWGNVWIGTTCEDQAAYDRRWPILREVNAVVHFISYEPAIGPIKLSDDPRQPEWIICGGESGGSQARPMDPQWAISMRDQCEARSIPFFFKQWGSHIPDDERRGRYRLYAKADSQTILQGRTHQEFPVVF